MGIWIVVGLPVSFVYCGLTYGVRQAILYALARWGSPDVTKVKYKS